MQENKNFQEVIDFDALFSQGNSKVNSRIKLTAEDKKANVRVFCKEPYAQEMYDKYYSSSPTALHVKVVSKDFEIDRVCKVIAQKVDFANKMIEARDIDSFSTIYIPFREFGKDPALFMMDGANTAFKVIIYKIENGHYLGSETRCAAITHKEDLEEFMKTDTWFFIKVTNLVKGGYLAVYKGTTKCFLPGSHAAANVIRDFNDYLNKEIPVMIENYDAANNLFIVSYKKYIKQTLPQRVHELKFGEKYTGILTNNPYDFGMFIEFQDYFTGLLHKTEFENYEAISKQYRSGDQIDFYVKDITVKKGEPRIVLTDSYEKISEENLAWQQLKDLVEGKTLEYTLDKRDFQLEIELPGSNNIFRTDVNHLKGRTRINDEGQVKIYKIDTIRKQMKYDFV